MDNRDRLFRSAYEDFRRHAALSGEPTIVADPDYGVGRRHCLFVYGTMKRGFRNHGRLEGKSRFIGEATTKEARFDLLTKQTSYVAPVLIEKPSHVGGYRVAGEVYEVTGPMLGIIDGHEGHPYHYTRTRILVEGVQGYVWAYLFDPVHRSLSTKGVVLDETMGTKTFTVKE